MTPRPTPTTSYQEDLYAQLSAWADADPDNRWDLLNFIGAIAAMNDQVEGYARDDEEGRPGWSMLVDIDRCPNEALPYLGQFVGVDVSKLSRITVLGPNTDGDPMGQTAGTIVYAGLGTKAIVNLPDGAVPIDTAAQSIVDKAAKFTADGTGQSWVAQILFVVPGKTYNLSMDIYTPAGAGTVLFTFDSATFSQIPGTAAPSSTPVAPGWFNLNTNFVAPASGVVYLIAGSAGAAGAFNYYTNFQVREVRPENDDEFFARMRSLIRNTGGYYRGSAAALRAAAQQFLSGSKTVIFKERDASVAPVYSGAYGLTVITYATETPDQAKVLAALLEQKPAGIKLDYEVINGTVWLVIRTVYPTWLAVRNAFLTWGGVRNNIPGT